jgi:hypothetical protein
MVSDRDYSRQPLDSCDSGQKSYDENYFSAQIPERRETII